MSGYYKSILFIPILLLACTTPEVAEWSPAESHKKTQIHHLSKSHWINIPAHASKRDKSEQAAFERFLVDKVGLPFASTVIVTEYGGHNADRIAMVRKALLRHGISRDLIIIQHADSSTELSKIKKSGVDIEVITYYVTPPSCKDWTESIGDAHADTNTRNFGCSVEHNLAMMIANPRDLIAGRSLADSDGTVIIAGVRRYHEDKVKQVVRLITTSKPSANYSSSSSSGGSSK